VYRRLDLNKIVIKILQGSVVTQTVLDGQTTYLIFLLQISYNIYVTKLWKTAGCRQSYCNNNRVSFYGSQ